MEDFPTPFKPLKIFKKESGREVSWWHLKFLIFTFVNIN